MFLQNKYTKWYFSIVEKARLEARSKKNCYYESHHSIPKSLGGSDKIDNKVLLTAKEHFICHLLLCRMTKEGSNERAKMLHAFMLMRGNNCWQFRYVGKTYNLIKKEYSIVRSVARRGIPMSLEQKLIRSMKMKGHKNLTEAGRAAISEKAKARPRKVFTQQDRLNIGQGMRLARQRRLAPR